MQSTDQRINRRHAPYLGVAIAMLLATWGCDRPPEAVDPSTQTTPGPAAPAAPVTEPAEEPAQEPSAPEPGADPMAEPPVPVERPFAGSPAHHIYLDAVDVREMGDIDAAKALLREAVTVDSEHWGAWSLLAELGRETDDFEAVADGCAGLLAHRTFDGWEAGQLNLECAMAQRAVGRIDEAERFARASVEFGGGRLEPLITLSGVLLEGRRAEEAVTLLEGAIRLPGGNLEASALSNLGSAYMQLDRLDAAVAAFESALEQNRSRVDIQLNMADALYRLERRDEAIEMIQRILVSNPDDERAQSRLERWQQ